MKNLMTALTALSLISGTAFAQGAHKQAQAAHKHATCTGSTPCKACKNCHYCKHCKKGGGKCGACKPSPETVTSNKRHAAVKPAPKK